MQFQWNLALEGIWKSSDSISRNEMKNIAEKLTIAENVADIKWP